MTPFHVYVDETSKYFDDARQVWSKEKPKYKLYIGEGLPGLGEVLFFLEQTSKIERCIGDLCICVNSEEWENKVLTPAHRKDEYLKGCSYIDIRRLVAENIKVLFNKYSKKPAEFALIAKLPEYKKEELSNCFTHLPRQVLSKTDKRNIKSLADILPADFLDKKIAEFISKYYCA